jgi:hypothetical protein
MGILREIGLVLGYLILYGIAILFVIIGVFGLIFLKKGFWFLMAFLLLAGACFAIGMHLEEKTKTKE